MSGSSSANNSWTILTPEETVAETLRPLTEGTEHHEETSAAGAEDISTPKGSPVEGHLVSTEQTAELSGDTSTEHHTFVPDTVTIPSVPTSFEVSSSFVPGSDALSQSEGLPEDPAPSITDPDSFSDSYTNITPSPDEPPASLLITETLEGGAGKQEIEVHTKDGTPHLLNEEELQQEAGGSDLSLRKHADSPVGSEVGKGKTEDEAEPEVRRRRRSLLTSLEKIGRTEEEEEEGVEEFQLPQQEEDSGFSLNKCILGAVILVGLGTIFFSESDYGTRDLKDSPGKQEWAPPPPGDADNMEIINKLAEGNQQLSLLQDQLQAQREELKVAKGQAAEGAKERLQWEEVEKENSRLKTQMASLPVLQKENERMKRELESVSALQKELETLRSTVTELKLSSAASESAEEPVKPTILPPSGQLENNKQVTLGTEEKQARKPWAEQKKSKKDLKDKYDIGEKKDSKDNKKSKWEEGKKRDKDVGKAEQGKHEQGKSDQENKKQGKHKKHSDETKKWKEKDEMKEKASRGDEGKPWKSREEKREWKEKSERKREKDWKKSKQEKINEDKQWKKKDENDWVGGNDYKERHRVKEESKTGKEWKKDKNGFKESGKDKWEKKDWNNDGEWKTKHGKDQGKEGKGNGKRKDWEANENRSKSHAKETKGKDERKQWSENVKDDKEWKRKDERKQWEKKEEWKTGGPKQKKHDDWKKDRSDSEKHKDDHSNRHHHHHEEHLWTNRNPPHTHSQPSVQQPEYWVQQRGRLQHKLKSPQHCSTLEACALHEGLHPVSLPEFEAVLQTYLAKAEEVGVEASVVEELRKLTTNFFKDGLFVHDQMSFQDFVEDVGDVLEDMVEGNENGDEEDNAIEEEMEEFEREVMKKFSVPGAGEKEEKIKEDWRKERGRGHG